MGDGDMLARLADTHHRVVISRGTDYTIVCGRGADNFKRQVVRKDQEVLFRIKLPPYFSGTGEGPDPRRIPIGASRA